MKNIIKSLLIAVFAITSLATYAQKNTKTKILFVLTSHDKLGDTGKQPVHGLKNLQHLIITF